MTSQSTDTVASATTTPTIDWRTIGRIFLKAAVLFVALNLLFAACRPLESLGNLSLYNNILPGRLRLPYGERPAEDFNLTLSNLPAMSAAHVWNRPAADDEFRVLLLGDSGIWGWFLPNEHTLAGQLNEMKLTAADGRRIVVYNLGYPIMSLTKDMVILDEMLAGSRPDLILWPVTLQSFYRPRQLDHPLLYENPNRVRELIEQYDLGLDLSDSRFVDRSFVQESIIGRRRELADLLRLQAWGVAWAATGLDQAIPEEITLRKSDFEPDDSWLDITEPRTLTDNDLAFDVLVGGGSRAGTIPLIIINEPMFIGDGLNSDVRYNTFYPRWAYDQYRQMLGETAIANNWNYIDLWNAIPPEEFTDTPVHLTRRGNQLFAALLRDYLTGRP
ncbi:MAG: SGNH/GDSL hydrolase family protein [Chloroflexota bacterium]